MSYGWQVRDASGNVRVSSDDSLTRLIHASVVAANASGTIDLTDADFDTGFALGIVDAAIDPASFNGIKVPHRVTMAAKVVTYTAVPATIERAPTLVLVFSTS